MTIGRNRNAFLLCRAEGQLLWRAFRKVLAPDVESIFSVGAEVHPPAILRPACVCAWGSWWPHDLPWRASIKRDDPAWEPPRINHFGNENPFVVGRYPGAMCHSIFVGRDINVALVGAALRSSGEGHMYARFDFREQDMVPVNP